MSCSSVGKTARLATLSAELPSQYKVYQSPRGYWTLDLGHYNIQEGGLLCEYMGHDVSNMRGFDSYRLLTRSLELRERV